MLKKLIPLLVVLPFLIAAKGPLPQRFRYVQVKDVKEISALPPKIEVTFSIMCNDEFVQLVRHEWTDPVTNKVSIALGGFVRENKAKKCGGRKQEVKVDAGTSFSGKEYEISKIRSSRY